MQRGTRCDFLALAAKGFSKKELFAWDLDFTKGESDSRGR